MVFAGGESIYVLDKNREERVATRTSRINALLSHNGVLYDAGGYGVVETLSGRQLASCETISLAGGLDGVYAGGGKGVFEVWRGQHIAARNPYTAAVVVHDEMLFDGGPYGVYETVHGRMLTARSTSVLLSGLGVLYDAGPWGVFETYSGRRLTPNGRTPEALGFHKGKLYDGGPRGIYSTFDSGREFNSGRLCVGHAFDFVVVEDKLIRAGLGVFEGTKDNRISNYSGLVDAICGHPRADFVEHGLLPPR